MPAQEAVFVTLAMMSAASLFAAVFAALDAAVTAARTWARNRQR